MSPSDAAVATRRIYIRCEGQNDNIGDVVLRRRLLDEFGKAGSLHIFIGKSSTGFVEGLRLRRTDRVFSSYKEWRSSLRQNATSEPTVYVDNPGELQINLRVALSYLRLLPLMRLIRKNGGCIFRLGVGARSRPSVYRLPFRIGSHYHQLVYWRDPVSKDGFGFGSVMPDWGFADRGPGESIAIPDNDGERDRLAVSLRGDRPYPGAAWIDGVRMYCRESRLKPVVVTQVKRDRDRGLQLAKDLSAEFVDWIDETHIAQELKLRDLYRHCGMAISDRLHVLILAMTEGATPVCLVDRAESKVGRHFDAIGYAGCSVDVTDQNAEMISKHLVRAEQRRQEIQKCMAFAVSEVERVAAEARRLMASRPA